MGETARNHDRKAKRPHAPDLVRAFIDAGIPIRARWMANGDFVIEPAVASQIGEDSPTVEDEISRWEKAHGDGPA